MKGTRTAATLCLALTHAVPAAAAKKGKRFGGKVQGAKTWGDVKAGFEKWSKDLRKQLDRVRAE